MLLLTIVWLTVNGLGLYTASFNDGLLGWKQHMEAYRAQTAGFLATEDPQFLNSQWVPHNDSQRLGSVLLDPAIHPILPLSIRKSLALAPSQGSPNASFIQELSLPSDGRLLKPGLWSWTGISSRFAVISAPSRFEYHVVKTTSLPFLFLYFSGNKQNISVFDSTRTEHPIRLLSGVIDRSWHPAFVYCPTETCTITGSADRSTSVLMEPKEIGFLSIAALVACTAGPVLLSLGVVLFVVLILLFVRKS